MAGRKQGKRSKIIKEAFSIRTLRKNLASNIKKMKGGGN